MPIYHENLSASVTESTVAKALRAGASHSYQFIGTGAESATEQSRQVQSTFWSAEHLANLSQSPVSEQDWMTLVATSQSSLLDLLRDSAPDGWYGRTSPAFCRLTTEGRLEPFSESWGNSGMGSRTEFLTLNTSEWPKDAAVCSLSDILETGDVPRRYFLSGRACKGILRRAERRGKSLPTALETALRGVSAHIEPAVGEWNSTTPARSSPKYRNQIEADYLPSGMAVRRLTPRETERLQGMSDDFTLIPYKGKPAADGPRYKAIGNSWAVPVLTWIAKRINEVEATETS